MRHLQVPLGAARINPVMGMMGIDGYVLVRVQKLKYHHDTAAALDRAR